MGKGRPGDAEVQPWAEAPSWKGAGQDGENGEALLALVIQVLDKGESLAGLSVDFPAAMWGSKKSADPLAPGWEARCLQELVKPAVLSSLGVRKREWACLPGAHTVLGGTSRDVGTGAEQRGGS